MKWNVIFQAEIVFSAVNYLDDFGGAEILEHAQKAYECLGELLNSCGLEESKKKSVEPTNRMTNFSSPEII
jgi:hypothetical protein